MTDQSTPLPDSSSAECRVAVRRPAELADALPYLLGFYPDDSIVLVALHGDRGRFGTRMRLGIPTDTAEWPAVSEQLAAGLLGSSDTPGTRPDGALVFLCQDPAPGETGRAVMERLRPLAQQLRTACGRLDMPVHEALCICDGRYWSYCCPDPRCCPAEGSPVAVPGTSAIAAAAAYAGIRVHGSLKGMEARLDPLGPAVAAPQEQALDAACRSLVPRMLDETDRDAVRAETLRLAGQVLERFRRAVPVPPGRQQPGNGAADAHDDALLADEEAAALITGLQDRVTRDRAAEWMEGEAALPALRLWRALVRRCVGAYADHAVAPLALAGWVAWSSGDHPGARVALNRALSLDPDYVFARLLHQACNENLDPEPLRRCMREERARREGSTAGLPS